MKILSATTLTIKQHEALDALAQTCCSHDNIRLSYPAEPMEEHCRHYLCYTEDDTLTAALALMFLDSGCAECSAFTHPAYRRRGHFTRLLHTALDDEENGEEFDILFAVSEACPDTIAALAALGAGLEGREHQMELVLTPPAEDSMPHLPLHSGLTLSKNPQTAPGIPAHLSEGDAEWILLEHGAIVGSCLITPASDSCACLHHVEIESSCRCKGYGADFMALLLPCLAQSGVRKLILQVSGDNAAALALYKKTGFRLTETLSYYCY